MNKKKFMILKEFYGLCLILFTILLGLGFGLLSCANPSKVNKTPQEAKLYNVGFDANGGLGTIPTKLKQKNADEALKLPTALPELALSKVDSYFIGWADSKTGTVFVSNPYLPSSDITLYAIWSNRPPIAITISFDANEGSGSQEPLIQLGSTSSVKLPNITTFKAPNDLMIFDYWSKTKDAKDKITSKSYSTDNDIRLYAIWKNAPNAPLYTINFDNNGGTGVIEKISQKKPNEFLKLPSNSNRMSYPGTTLDRFIGWVENKIETNPIANPYYQPKKDITLYACWAIDSRGNYNINYYPTGSDAASGAPGADIQYNPYEEITLAWPDSYFVKYGYAFNGWSLSIGGPPLPQTYAISEYMTILYPVWVKLLKISFDLNGATGGNPPIDIDVKPGDNVTLPPLGTAISKAGFIFGGWATLSAATSVLPSNYIPKSDIKLYATWIKN